MDATAAELRDRLLEAFLPWIRERLSALAMPLPPRMDEALEEGRGRLASELDLLLDKPFEDQRRGPLELFQMATGFATEVLRQAGLGPVRRDPATEVALPEDVYDLAPASSQDLGEWAWRAHIAWGAAKARAMSGGSPGGRPGGAGGGDGS